MTLNTLYGKRHLPIMLLNNQLQKKDWLKRSSTNIY